MPSAHTPSVPLRQPEVAARGTKVCLGPGVRYLFPQHFSARCVLLVTLTAILALYALPARAQDPGGSTAGPSETETSDPQTIFPHPDSTRWWISGQFNNIAQGHPSFSAKYSGAHSLDPRREIRDSRVMTLFTGLELTHSTEILFDPEITQGHGISDALGLAGFTNLDVVRNPDLGSAPYIARVMIHQIIPLSHETSPQPRGPLSLFTQLPLRRLELRAGKMALTDFFDVNAVGGDDHLQFLNWTDVNNGAYDYAADTRGYTYGAVLDYEDRAWGFRFAEALISKRPNGLTLQKNLQDAHSENYELEFRPRLLENRDTAVRLLAFTNFANMGDYHQALDLFEQGKTPTPEIDDHPMRTTLKYGFGFNAEQEFNEYFRGFARAGWNEGEHESFNYTEVNETVAFGGDVRGTLWNRPQDKFGGAFVGNGL